MTKLDDSMYAEGAAKCPICDGPVKYDNAYMDHCIMSEEYSVCINHKHYCWEWTYGNTTVMIGEEQFTAHYADDEQTRKEFTRVTDEAIKKLRESLGYG